MRSLGLLLQTLEEDVGIKFKFRREMVPNAESVCGSSLSLLMESGSRGGCVGDVVDVDLDSKCPWKGG